MRRRRWTVVQLSEFYPKNPRLYGLNVNKGQHVKLRLRRAGGGPGLLDWNTVLGTMLHELVHNDISPHNAAFYKLLDELWEEAEALMDKGIHGCGSFDGPSVGRLGSHGWIGSHNPPEAQLGDAIRKVRQHRGKVWRPLADAAALGSGSATVQRRRATAAPAPVWQREVASRCNAALRLCCCRLPRRARARSRSWCQGRASWAAAQHAA